MYLNRTKEELQLLETIASIIQTHHSFLITTHVDPDGDAIGSSLAMADLLLRLGKKVTFFDPKPFPSGFHFLAHFSKQSLQIPPETNFDVSFLLDCGEIDRSPLQWVPQKQRGQVLVIDHHKTSGCEGDLNWNDPEAPCVGVLVYELAETMKQPLTLDFAENVYCSILSDTGSFRYKKATPRAFWIAGKLVEAGVSPWKISSSLYENVEFERQKLLALALDSLELNTSKQVALIVITNEMLAKANATTEMSEGFVNFGRSIQGVEISILCREHEEGWKLSLRSREEADVTSIAQHFGGGGHPRAAGALIKEKNLEKVLQEVKEMADQYCQEHLSKS